MPINLQSFAESGETSYIAKHNANVAALVAFLGSVESSLASVAGGGSGLANAGNIGKATYGTSGVAFVGSGSFAYSLAADVMTLDPGFCWDATLGIMNYKADSTALQFGGRAAGTYYIRFGGDSVPYISSVSTASDIYSVDWGGATFNNVTTLATVTPTAPDIGEMADSLYSGITYPTPAERLDATEKAFSRLLAADMSGGDYTPSTAQVMEAIGVKLTGALTTTNTLTVPAKAKVLVVRNDTTTANASGVLIKTPAGTGVTLLAGEHAVLYCDGTNVFHIFRQGAADVINSLLDLGDTPSSFTGQGLRLLQVRGDETGTEFVDPTSVLSGTQSVSDEGVLVDATVDTMDFVGAGVTVTQTAPGQILITIPGGTGGGGAALEAQDEGISTDAAVVLINFAGDGVTVSQTSPGNILVTIPGGAGGGNVDYDIAFFIGDKRPAGETVFRHTFTKAVDFAADFALSDGDAISAATASAVFLLKKNGTTVGTITFAASGSVATFNSSGAPLSFLVGDTLECVAPDPQDATLAGVSITLAGTRV